MSFNLLQHWWTENNIRITSKLYQLKVNWLILKQCVTVWDPPFSRGSPACEYPDKVESVHARLIATHEGTSSRRTSGSNFDVIPTPWNPELLEISSTQKYCIIIHTYISTNYDGRLGVTPTSEYYVIFIACVAVQGG